MHIDAIECLLSSFALCGQFGGWWRSVHGEYDGLGGRCQGDTVIEFLHDIDNGAFFATAPTYGCVKKLIDVNQQVIAFDWSSVDFRNGRGKGGAEK